MSATPRMRYAFIDQTCGNPAFLHRDKPEVGDIVTSEGALLLDGSRPKKHAGAVCGSCGVILSMLLFNVDEVVEIESLTPEQRAFLPEEYR